MNKENINRLNKAREEYQEKIRKGELERPKQKTLVEKWLENKKSLRASINYFCWQCIGENINDIKYCSALDCPLYEVRPYQEKINE